MGIPQHKVYWDEGECKSLVIVKRQDDIEVALFLGRINNTTIEQSWSDSIADILGMEIIMVILLFNVYFLFMEGYEEKSVLPYIPLEQ